HGLWCDATVAKRFPTNLWKRCRRGRERSRDRQANPSAIGPGCWFRSQKPLYRIARDEPDASSIARKDRTKRGRRHRDRPDAAVPGGRSDASSVARIPAAAKGWPPCATVAGLSAIALASCISLPVIEEWWMLGNLSNCWPVQREDSRGSLEDPMRWTRTVRRSS